MKHKSIFFIMLLVFSSLASLAEESDFYTLKDSDKYFTLDGKTRYYTGRTPWESTLAAMITQFDIAAAAGEKIIRLNGIYIGLGYKYLSGWEKFMTDGTPDAAFFNEWDKIFEAGAERGLHFCVTLDVHTAWQVDESVNYKFDLYNIFNVTKKGPAEKPTDILYDEATQKKYLEYIKLCVQKMSKHENIFTWEIISELNVSFRGAEDSLEREYIRESDSLFRKVYRVIHENDPLNRPVNIALAERPRGVPVEEWEEAIFGNDSICDFTHTHSYPSFRITTTDHPGGLTINNIELLNRNLKYNKLIFIGECDLGFQNEAAQFETEGIDIEYRKSLWGNMVFGISNGGMWWFHSGYGGSDFTDFKNKWPKICKPVNDFVKDIDFTGMDVIAAGYKGQVMGSAIGNKDVIIGYFWNKACEYNYSSPSESWPTDIEISSTIALKAGHSDFFNTRQTVHFYNPEDLEYIKTDTVDVSGTGLINIDLPAFFTDIVFSIGYMYNPLGVSVPEADIFKTRGDIDSQNACDNISVYLNSANDYLYVTNTNSETVISVYSTSGYKLKEVKGQSRQTQISMADLQKGIYIISIRTADGTCVRKIIK